MFFFIAERPRHATATGGDRTYRIILRQGQHFQRTSHRNQGFLLAVTMQGHGMSFGETGLHFFAGAIGLAAGMALFAAGFVGGH